MHHQQVVKPPRKKLKAFLCPSSGVLGANAVVRLNHASLPANVTSHYEDHSGLVWRPWRPKSLIGQNMQKQIETLALPPKVDAVPINNDDTESDSDEEDAAIQTKKVQTVVPAAVMTTHVATVDKQHARPMKYTFVVGSDTQKGKDRLCFDTKYISIK